MQSQSNDIKVIEQEMQVVKKLANLPNIDEIIFNDEGWDSRVYSTNNGCYFFKFPRSEKVRNRYTQQITALKLAGQVDAKIKVPKIIWEHPSNNYLGYQGVEGVALAGVLPILKSPTKQNIGETLGAFLKQFHQLKLADVRVVNIEDEIKQYQDWYLPAEPEINSNFNEDEQRKLKKLVYKIWPTQLRALGSDAALCHADFGFKNIFYDDGQVGIIDFGDVCLCDQSKDFIGLNDEIIFESALKTYGDSKELRQKIVLRQDTREIIKLTASIKKQDALGIQKSLNRLKEIVNQSKV
jgi:aminoglycoside phosphotransferase (APT) family kinase protein